MAAALSNKCKTCTSEHRLDIEAWHTEGKTSREISVRLKALGEKISDRAIDNHFATHYDVTDEVKEQYAQSQLNLEAEAGERVNEIKALDDLVAGKIELHKKLEAILGQMVSKIKIEKDTVAYEIDLPKLPQAYVNLYNGLSAEIRQALKTKQELLGEDPGSKKAGALESWIDLMMEDEGAAESGAGAK